MPLFDTMMFSLLLRRLLCRRFRCFSLRLPARLFFLRASYADAADYAGAEFSLRR